MRSAGAPGTASDRYRDVVHVTTEDVTDAKTPTALQARAIDLLELNPDHRPPRQREARGMSEQHVVILNERTRSGGETGAGVMRNRCAFTPRDMGADWPEAFTYAVVAGWDDATEQMATRWEWDPALVEFLSDAHRRFQELPDRNDGAPTRERREA